MDMQAERMGRGIDLMGDDSAGIFCSEEVMGSSDTMTGDQLRRFIHHQEALQNPRLIGYGRQAVMVLATSKGVEYVFKVFKKWEETGPVFAASYREAVEASPFAKECRAFGRLDSLKRNGTWAVRCYGWMKLTDEQFETIGSLVDNHNMSRWVIVKEHLLKLPLPEDVPAIFAKFDIARLASILPQDIRMGNYRESKILDLSGTLTGPCPAWSEFQFHHFYEKTTRRVLDWYECTPLDALDAVYF
ncbi:uncharacterized protein PV07_08794 [Cladophialophora immunda]|uniref:Aminoglycoside phosphotransferase domain-containing protein n=1 Tax=Cladophialophora immunda TaxID=569365 RepID=A0A0D2C344_9EURO|nr:uncharacterized protein PV07_08794 [Cladophialophora immunda]KIW25628.1 hypothetical protein PV07_08794 [Cladophialophora immunda]OQV11019.1 hypothetical protein CLAIMM_14925 isoform 1 [Cladophialophora immunda]